MISILLLLQTLVSLPQIRGGGLWRVSGPLGFGPIPPASCIERNLPAPGVAPGMPIAPAWPSNLPQSLYGMAYAGADVIVFRLCNVSAGSVPEPSPAPVFGAQVVVR